MVSFLFFFICYEYYYTGWPCQGLPLRVDPFYFANYNFTLRGNFVCKHAETLEYIHGRTFLPVIAQLPRHFILSSLVTGIVFIPTFSHHCPISNYPTLRNIDRSKHSTQSTEQTCLHTRCLTLRELQFYLSKLYFWNHRHPL